MKYTVKQYAEALSDVLLHKPKDMRATARRFIAIARENGDSAKLELILRAFEKEYLKRKKLRAVNIEMSSAVPTKVKRDIKQILGGEIVFSEQENPALGAGIKIIVDGEILIDASAERQLKILWQSKL